MINSLDEILARPAREWTNEEANTVYKTMKEHGKETVKIRMEQVRALNT